MPNYTPYAIPNITSLLEAFSQIERDRAGMSAQGLAESFGFADSESLAPFFDEINMQPIEEGLSQIPQLQNFLHGNARGSYIDNMGLLGRKMGRTNLQFGSNDYAEQIDRQFSNDMLSSDQQIQGLVDKFRGLLGDQFESQRQSAQTALAGGADLLSDTPWGQRDMSKEDWNQQQRQHFGFGRWR